MLGEPTRTVVRPNAVKGGRGCRISVFEKGPDPMKPLDLSASHDSFEVK